MKIRVPFVKINDLRNQDLLGHRRGGQQLRFELRGEASEQTRIKTDLAQSLHREVQRSCRDHPNERKQMSKRHSNQKIMNQGEGDRAADRRYRKGLSEFVKVTYHQKHSEKRKRADERSVSQVLATPTPLSAETKSPIYILEQLVEMVHPLWNIVEPLWTRLNGLSLVVIMKAKIDGWIGHFHYAQRVSSERQSGR